MLEEQRRSRLERRSTKPPALTAATENEVARLIQHGLTLQKQGNLAFAAEAYQRALAK
jgi:hypothetical protein